MTMDFSRLHTYTPPQCAPENTGYTYSLSSSYSSAALEFEKEHHIAPVFDSPRMSRRSLRLQTTTGHYGNDSLADFSQNYGVSYSSGGSGRREARTVRSRKQQSVSSSQSLAETPRKTLSFSTTHTPTSGEQQSCAASDASLLSSILDQSSLRQHTTTTTTTDGYWGSNQDTDLRGRSLRADRSFSKVNGDVNTSVYHQTHATTGVNGNMCKDCSIHSERKEALTTYSSSSKFSSSSSSQSAATAAALSSSSSASIHCRDTSLKNKTGVLVSFSHTCIHHSRRALASIVSLVTLLFQNALWLGSRAKSHQGKGLLTSLSESVRRAVSSSVSCLWLFKQNALHRVMGYRANGYEGKAHSSYCGSMNVRDLVTGDGHLNMNGSLCDDCKGKQHSETHTAVHAQSSRARRLAGALWSILAFAGYCLLQPGYCVVRAGRALGSAVGAVAQRLQTVLWLVLAAPGKAARGLLWYAASGWYQLVSLMSLLNVFILTRCLPKLLKLLLFLLPFLLLLGLWLWGPSSFLCFLPAINLTESWRSVSPITLLSTLAPTAAPAPAPATPVEPTPAPPVLQTQPPLPPVVVPVVDTESLERLERMERRLAVLWEQVQQGDQRQEQRHGDTLAVYHSLRQQLDTQTDRDSLGLWVSGLLENRLSLLRGELEQGNAHRTQSEEQQKKQQQSQEARLAEVDVLLLALAAKTEEVQQKQQEKEKAPPAPAPAPAPVSAGVDQEAHDALLAEVQRLEAELGRIRQDLQGVMGCKGKCEQLDTLHETVSAQVRRELRAVFYGGAEAGEDQGGEVPEALLAWLSERYVSGADLQASLASLELSILRNVSLQLELEQIRAQAAAEAQAEAAARRLATLTQSVTHSVQTTAVAQGLTEEQVQLIVQNALKLYSQDRTGLVDYALESGGGSILSTRCSETYETKTALMSLFGLPLWYFSQSPRVVIQPDVYPGNCWAFKGSQGYLVIRLSLSILPTAFCLEHIPKALSPTGTISSAPRNFTVFGLEDEYQEGGTLLGHYTYQEDGDSLQTFPVMEKNDKAFQIIEVRVLTNWGHPEYTCLYRFRVHGEPHIQ